MTEATTDAPADVPAGAACAVPMVTGIHHLGLTVSDVEVSEAWYARTLGLVRAFIEQHDNETGFAVVMTRPGTGLFLGLDHHADADRLPFDARRTGLDHLCLNVQSREEVDAWAAHFDAIGEPHGPVNAGQEPLPHALVQVHDPDGIPVELMWLDA